MRDATEAAARTTYRAAHTSGKRARDPRIIVIHTTEGDTAEGAAAWFRNRSSGGSANMVVDNDAAYRTLEDNEIPWAAPPRNEDGWHIEFAGHASSTRAAWMSHRRVELDRGAYKIALRAAKYDIPLRKLGRLGLLLRRKGVTTHALISSVYRKSDHHDPGVGFPVDYVLEKARQYAGENL